MNSLATNPDAIASKNRPAPTKAVNVAWQCLLLTIASATLWGTLYYPAWRFAGPRGVEGLTYAAVLCTVPGYLAFAISGLIVHFGSYAGHGALLSTGLRLMTVGIATVVLQTSRPDLRFWDFHIWLIVFYVAALAFETIAILKGIDRNSPSPQRQ